MTCSYSPVTISHDHANRPSVWADCGWPRFRPIEPNHDLPKSIDYSDGNQGSSVALRSDVGSAAQSMSVTIRYPARPNPSVHELLDPLTRYAEHGSGVGLSQAARP